VIFMLKFFRKHARGWFMLAFMAIIIFVFVLYFGSDRGSRSANAIAVIDGKVISEGEYHNEFSKLADMVKVRYGGRLTDDMLKQMNLKQMAYDSLINRQIIIAKAADLKVQISDEELRDSIMQYPTVQTDGVFDERKYQQLLRYNKLSAEDFEATQRINLTAVKIESIIREGIKIADQEVLDLYTMQNQKMNVNFVQLTPGSIKKNIAPSMNELEGYLKNNSNAFRIPEQVKVKYIFFAAMDNAASPSENELRDYYNRTKDRYKTKEGKPLPIEAVKNDILKELKLAKGMQNASAEAKKAHDIIYQEDNFDAYASKNNLRIHSLDFFPLNKPPQEFAFIKDLSAQLSGLQKKDLSRVLASVNGYYVLSIIDKKEAYTPQLKDIESEVRKRFEANELKLVAEKEANVIIDRLKKGDSLETIAREKGLKIEETGFFQAGNVIPKLGAASDAMENLLQLSANKPYTDKPLNINNTYVVLKLKATSDLDMKDFEAKKDVYKKILTNIKREEALKAWLEGNKAALIKDKRLQINKEVKEL
jgi:peptidyl-prolyl cis-trans isomerase D